MVTHRLGHHSITHGISGPLDQECQILLDPPGDLSGNPGRDIQTGANSVYKSQYLELAADPDEPLCCPNGAVV